MSHAENDKAIDRIRELEDNIACLQSEIVDALSNENFRDAQDAYDELIRNRKELAALAAVFA